MQRPIINSHIQTKCPRTFYAQLHHSMRFKQSQASLSMDMLLVGSYPHGVLVLSLLFSWHPNYNFQHESLAHAHTLNLTFK